MDKFTEMTDVNCSDIYLGHKVRLFGVEGRIVFECGAFGIGFDKCIDYEMLQKEMDDMDWCCGNKWAGCMNDNFLSLWELFWNFNCDEDCIDVLEIVK